MKNNRNFVIIFISIYLTLLSSCNLFLETVNALTAKDDNEHNQIIDANPPIVTISVEKTEIQYDEKIILTAHPHSKDKIESQSFEWLVNDIIQENNIIQNFLFSAKPLENTNYSITVNCRINGTEVSDSKIITVLGIGPLEAPKTISSEGYIDCIGIYWSNVSQASSYNIFRSMDGSEDSYQLINSINAREYFDYVSTDDKHFYKVAAVAQDGRVSGFSAVTSTAIINELQSDLLQYSISPYNSNWSRISGIVTNISGNNAVKPQLIIKALNSTNEIIEIRSTTFIPEIFQNNAEFPFIIDFYSSSNEIASIKASLGYTHNTNSEILLNYEFSFDVVSIETASFPYLGVEAVLAITNNTEKPISKIYAYCTDYEGNVLNISEASASDHDYTNFEEISVIFSGISNPDEVSNIIIYCIEN